MATENPESKRKVGGGKLARSETVTVRLDPKLRYLAELSALKQRRTVSSFIEWAIEDCLSRINLKEAMGGAKDQSVADVAAQLWDVDEADRFVKLAVRFPDLLTHDEQKLWKLIRESPALWHIKVNLFSGQELVEFDEESFRFERLRENWAIFCKVANGTEPRSSLPVWPNVKSKRKAGFEDIDDPF
jgi:hypothetical protein